MSTINGTQINHWKMHRPPAGCIRCDVVAAEGEALAVGSAVTIKSGTLEIKGKVMRSGLDAVDRPHTVVIVGLGWLKNVEAPLSFQSDGGVKLHTVLSAINGYAKETLEKPTDRTIGEYFECVASRPNEPISWADVLNDLVRIGACGQWRVDPDGVTRFGDLPASTVNTRATLMTSNRGLGIATYGIDDPAQFKPGATLDGAVIDRVDLRESDGKFEIDVYTSASTPSIREMVRRMVAAEIGDRTRTYHVARCGSDGRCDLSPPPDATHLPEIGNCEQWITGGGTFFAAAGDEATVEFRDWKKTRPVITGFRRASGSGPAAFPPAARQGDLVQFGGIGATINLAAIDGTPVLMVDATLKPMPGPWLISHGSILGPSPGPIPPTISPPMQQPGYGTISSGSALFGIKK